MIHLTELVLTGVFSFALGLFVLSALVRAVREAVRMDGKAFDPAAAGFGLPAAHPGGKVAVWFYHPLDLLGAGFVFGLFAMLVLARVPPSAVHVLGVRALLVNIGFQIVMAGGLAIWVVRRVGWVQWLGLRWPGWPWIFLIAPCSVLFMWAVFSGLQLSGYVKWMESLGVDTVQDTVRLLQKSADPLLLGLMTLAAVVAAPVCEEIVFRGYFYPVLKRFAGIWPAALCSALVFASAHGNLTALLPLFLFGGLLVFVYEKTGSLWAPIAVHCCFNSATVLVQMAARYYHLPLPDAP